MDPTTAEPVVNVNSFWLPDPGSSAAESIDWSWNVVLGISIVFFTIIMVLMFTFLWKYRRKSDYDITSDMDHSTRLEVIWTVIPFFVVVGLFFVGFKGFLYAAVAPGNAYAIQVQGQKWAWSFTYPEGVTTNELTVPEGRPIKLIMSSSDVIHSFYVPELRVKRDVIPGLYTTLWFEANKVFESVVFCTEYCGGSGDGRQGSGHSAMWTRIHVLSQSDFDKWLEKNNEGALPPLALGEKLYRERACVGCHSLDGAKMAGPTWKGLFGAQRQFQDGTSTVADENYLRESILRSTAKVVAGYQPVMPVYEGQLKDNQVAALIEYIKTIK